MGAASKQKGSAFERDVCRDLSRWVSGGEKIDLFWRSAMSGGRATVARAKGDTVRQAGDICAVAPEGHALTDRWYVECKFYKDLQLPAFFLMQKGKLAEFWERALSEAKSHGRMPFLIAKQNLYPAIALFEFGRHPGRAVPRVSMRLMQTGFCDIWLLSDLLKLPFKVI